MLKTNKRNRVISLILSVLMLVGLLTVSVSAETTKSIVPADRFGIYADSPTVKDTKEVFKFTGGASAGYFFVTYKLNDVDFEDCNKIELRLSGHWDNTSGVNVYNVITPWDSSTGTYTVGAAPIATAATFLGLREVILDITDYIQNLADRSSVSLMLCAATPTPKESIVYNNNTLQLRLTYADPSTKPCEFYEKTDTKIEAVSTIAVTTSDMKTDQSSAKAFNFLNNNRNLNDFGYLFLTYDIKNIDFNNLTSATLTLYGYWNTSNVVGAYNVTTPWSSTDGSYDKDPAAVATVPAKNNDRSLTLDLTDYILKSAGADAVNLVLCAMNTPGDTTKQGIVYLGSGLNKLSVTYEKKVEKLSDIQSDCKLVAKRKVYQGSADETVTGLPITALYNGNKLIAAVNGDSISLDGSYKTVSGEIDVKKSELTQNSVARFFLWESLGTLVPLEDCSEITYE